MKYNWPQEFILILFETRNGDQENYKVSIEILQNIYKAAFFRIQQQIFNFICKHYILMDFIKSKSVVFEDDQKSQSLTSPLVPKNMSMVKQNSPPQKRNEVPSPNLDFKNSKTFAEQVSSFYGSQKTSMSNIQVSSSKYDKEIDFNKMFEDYRKRTEFNMPHTSLQIKDVIFVSQNRLVALEFIYYSSTNDNQFFLLEQKKNAAPKTNIMDIKTSARSDQKAKNQSSCSKWNSSSGFSQEPTMYVQSSEPVHPTPQEGQFLEAFISIWKINAKGQLAKHRQQPVKFDHDFQPTNTDLLQLFLSLDRQIVTLGVVSSQDELAAANESIQSDDSIDLDKKELSIKSWHTKNLIEVDITEELQTSLNKNFHGTLQEICFVGEGNYVQMIQMCSSMLENETQQQKLHQIFDRVTGEKILEVGNFDANQLLNPDKDNGNLQFIGMLTRDKDANLVDTNDVEDEDGLTRKSAAVFNDDFSSCKSDTISENSMITDSQVEYVQTHDTVRSNIRKTEQLNKLNLILFFIGTNTSKNKQGVVVDRTALTFVDINLKQLIKNALDDQAITDQDQNADSKWSNFEINMAIMKQGLNKLSQFEQSIQDFYEIPKNWFLDDKNQFKQWYTSIDLGATKFFNHIGILNRQERLFLAFTCNENECDSHRETKAFDNEKEIGRFYVPENSVCSIVRNQSTKRFLFLTLRTREANDGGCIAHCFYHKTQKQSISFNKDHLKAIQDVQTQPYEYKDQMHSTSHKFADKKQNKKKMSRQKTLGIDQMKEFSEVQNKYLLQSCSISEFTQEIYLNTETAIIKDGAQEFDYVYRKSISQRFNANFPLLAYNLGFDKVLIQDTQGQQRAYIFKIPQGEQFIDFIEYNYFYDIDFYQGNFKKCLSELQIEICSNFVFLTQKKLPNGNPILVVNILFVNPYKSDFTVAHFQSSKCFEHHMSSDLAIKNIMYSTRKNKNETDSQIKLLTQFSSSFVQREFRSKSDAYFDRQELREEGGEVTHNIDSADDDENNYGSRQRASDNQSIKNLEPIPMLLTRCGYIYYVTRRENFFLVNQINLKQDSKGYHRPVFEKSLMKIKCFGLLESGNLFYLIDEHKNITLLKQDEDTMVLVESGQLYIKDHEKPSISLDPWENIIVDHKYIINECNIFYLTEFPITKSQQKLVIKSMEDLSYLDDFNVDDEKKINAPSLLEKNMYKSMRSFTSSNPDVRNRAKTFTFGPIKFKGSEQIIIIYEASQSYEFLGRVYQIPDSSKVSLINQDVHQNQKHSFSTFFESQDQVLILTKQGHTFSVFDNKGVFVCLVEKRFLGAKPTGLMAMMAPKQACTDSDHDNTRLDLLTLSNNIKFFLFIDQKLKKLVVYELKLKPENKLFENFKQQMTNKLQQKKLKVKISFRKNNEQRYEFAPIHELNLQNTQLFQSLDDGYPITTGRTPRNDFDEFMSQYRDNEISIQITDAGDVMFFTHVIKGGQSMEVAVSIFLRGKEGKNADEFTQIAKFPGNMAPENITVFINEEKELLQQQIEIERLRVKQLPEHFQDFTQIENLEKKLKQIESKKNSIVKYYIFGSLMLVQCGHQVNYGFLPTGSKEDEKELKDVDMQQCILNSNFVDKPMNCQLEENTIIVEMIETKLKNIIQIVARNDESNIFYVITWDFNQNIEHQMYQITFNPDEQPENQVSRGICGPQNYFIGEHFVYDLQNNIPYQTAHESGDENFKPDDESRKFKQAMKIYTDPSRYLCIESPNLLHFPVNRIDILQWDSIVDNHKENANLIKTRTGIKDFSKIYDKGQSLFHYFADNVNVIEMFSKKFTEARQNNQLPEREEDIPLLIMRPNYKYCTAMDLAMQKLRPKCFELLLDLLNEYDYHFLTKLMLDCIPNMIIQDTNLVKKFFDNCIYKSPQMELAKVIQWPQDLDEIIFPCHTSIISIDILTEHIAEFISQEQLSAFDKNSQEIKEHKQVNYTKLPDYFSFVPTNSLVKRISMEAIDLDWVFREDNARNLILHLQNFGNGDLYNQKVLRIFINLIWEKYQPLIIKRVYIPFIIFLTYFVSLSSWKAGPYLDKLGFIEEDQEIRDYVQTHKWCLLKQSAVVYIGLFYFAWIEYQQIKLKGAKDYFGDPWNYFDIAYLNTCSFYVICVNTFVINQKFRFYWVFKLRLFGGFSCFLIWIKMFYWMRIFSSTAHFVTLISRTVKDIKVFCLMLSIILLAFANVYLTLNNNTTHNKTYIDNEGYAGQSSIWGSLRFTYLDDLYDNDQYSNALLNMYMMSLGTFFVSDFKYGPNPEMAWVFFILASFIIQVVFMNMLIAIMGETFSQVREQIEESQLSEQLGLIEDHIWLLDLNKEFKGQKYIIRLCPDEIGFQDSQNLVEEFHNLSQEIVTKNQSMHHNIKSSNSLTEQRMREMMKQQQIKNNKSNKFVQSTSSENHVMIDRLYDQVRDQMHSQQKAFQKMTDNFKKAERKSSSEIENEKEESQLDQYKKVVLMQDMQIKELISMHQDLIANLSNEPSQAAQTDRKSQKSE